jgi:uncharacterized membrane protein
MRKYLVTGLLIWIPLVITIWVLNLIVATMDQSLQLLPAQLHPRSWFGHDIPGLGALLSIAVVVLTGVAARNFIGERLLLYWEGLLGRIPIVRSIYSSVKQVSDTILSPSGQAFRQALLVQYPRTGVWTIGFLTGAPADEVRRHVDVDMISVYVPTTPNPTSGFFLMMPRAETVELNMSVDQALKYVVSMGVVAPHDRGAPMPRAPGMQPRPGVEPVVPTVAPPLNRRT